jgi:hypothetical protein
MAVSRGQLEYEWHHLQRKLADRDPDWSGLRVARPRAHPLFRVPGEGGLGEKWRPSPAAVREQRSDGQKGNRRKHARTETGAILTSGRVGDLLYTAAPGIDLKTGAVADRLSRRPGKPREPRAVLEDAGSGLEQVVRVTYRRTRVRLPPEHAVRGD